MKPLKYLLLISCSFALTNCQWPEQEKAPRYVKESVIVKFYNNGDSTLKRMTLNSHFYYPVEDQELGGNTSKAKILNLENCHGYSCYILHTQDSIVYEFGDCYIGCIRYIKFAVYNKDETSPNGYRLRGQYIVDNTIRQKYEVEEYKKSLGNNYTKPLKIAYGKTIFRRNFERLRYILQLTAGIIRCIRRKPLISSCLWHGEMPAHDVRWR